MNNDIFTRTNNLERLFKYKTLFPETILKEAGIYNCSYLMHPQDKNVINNILERDFYEDDTRLNKAMDNTFLSCILLFVISCLVSLILKNFLKLNLTFPINQLLLLPIFISGAGAIIFGIISLAFDRWLYIKLEKELNKKLHCKKFVYYFLFWFSNYVKELNVSNGEIRNILEEIYDLINTTYNVDVLFDSKAPNIESFLSNIKKMNEKEAYKFSGEFLGNLKLYLNNKAFYSIIQGFDYLDKHVADMLPTTYTNLQILIDKWKGLSPDIIDENNMSEVIELGNVIMRYLDIDVNDMDTQKIIMEVNNFFEGRK